MNTKTFDCVDMKRMVQERIYEATKGMSPSQEIEYTLAEAEKFRRDLAAMNHGSRADLEGVLRRARQSL